MYNLDEKSRNPKYHILFVSHQGQVEGGADLILALIIENLNYDVFQPFVLVPRKKSLAKQLDTKNITYMAEPYRGWINQSKNYLGRVYRATINLISFLRLLPSIKTYEIDLIYSNTLYTPIGCMLAWYLKIPHIWHVHENVEEGLGKYFDFGKTRSLTFANANSQAFICVSQAVYDAIKAYFDKEKVKIIYNPVPNSDRYLSILSDGKPKSRLILSVIGSVSAHKRPEDAIHALKIVRENNIDAQLQIVGGGNESYLTELKSLATNLGVSEYISWLGYVSDMRPIYDSTDIVLVCTFAEGFGLVIIEAMAAGCPVVATNSGGIPEIIKHGISGLLFQPKDYQKLAEHIITLVHNQHLYSSIVNEGRNLVRNQYTTTRYINDLETIIYNVLSTRNKSTN